MPLKAASRPVDYDHTVPIALPVPEVVALPGEDPSPDALALDPAPRRWAGRARSTPSAHPRPARFARTVFRARSPVRAA